MNAKMVSRHTKDGNQDIYSSSENDETTRTYRMLYSTKEHIYALYWGIANKDFGKTGKVCYILKFDWNGNLKEGFKVNNLLFNFATLFFVLIDKIDSSIRVYNTSNSQFSCGWFLSMFLTSDKLKGLFFRRYWQIIVFKLPSNSLILPLILEAI